MSQPHRKSKGSHGTTPAPAPAPAQVAPALPRRQALLVPGMHRSGTSALTGVLSHLGARPPRTLLPNAKDNPRGFWESAEVVKFNDQILASAGSRWDDWEPFNRDWMASAAAEPFLERVPELLEKEYGDARLLLLKDPRICRLMPFWTEALRRQDIAARVVIPLRHPGEVAGSLETRNKFGRNRVLLIWLRHVLEAELATRELPRTLLHFEDLLQDWRGQCKRISEELGIAWPRWSGAVEVEIDEYLSAELRHQRVLRDQVTPNTELQGWIDTARQALDTLVATQGRDPAARAALDGVREDFDRRSSIFASVVSEYALASQGMQQELDTLRQGAESHEQALAALRAEDERKAALITGLESSGAANARLLATAETTVDNVAAQLALQDRVIADMRALLADREQELQAQRNQSAVRTEELTRQVDALTTRADMLEVERNAAQAQLTQQADAALARIGELNELSQSRAGELAQALVELEALSTTAEGQARHLAALEVTLADQAERLAAQDVALAHKHQQVAELTAQMETRDAQEQELATQLDAARQWEAQALAWREELRVKTAEADRLKASSEKLMNQLKSQVDSWVARIDAGVRQVAEANKDLALKNREQERRISERFKEIERLTQLLLRADHQIAERDSQAALLQMRIGELQARVQAIETSRTWRLGSPARRLAAAAKRLRHGQGGNADAVLVRQSDWFDAAWYSERYPDVVAAGIEPAVHYLEFGAKEGRDPGPKFDTRYYLQAYPDVAASGINPLVHFLRHGRSEERKARLSNA